MENPTYSPTPRQSVHFNYSFPPLLTQQRKSSAQIDYIVCKHRRAFGNRLSSLATRGPVRIGIGRDVTLGFGGGGWVETKGFSHYRVRSAVKAGVFVKSFCADDTLMGCFDGGCKLKIRSIWGGGGIWPSLAKWILKGIINTAGPPKCLCLSISL